MNIVATVYNIKQLNSLVNLATHVLLPVENFTSCDGVILDESIALCEKINIIPILRMDAMLHEDMLDSFRNIILKYKNSNALFYVTDLGAANILINNNIIHRCIFDPQTLICNNLDAEIYQSMGFDAISMSLEITINDVIKAIESSKLNVFYQVFGHRLMFNSKRMLVSLYENKQGLSINRDNMYLIEEKRSDKYPIIETKLGTYIYRSYQISLINLLDKLNIKYAYFESRFIDYNVYLNVLSIYKEYINEIISIDEANARLSLLPLNVEDGFTFKDSVYQKEEF